MQLVSSIGLQPEVPKEINLRTNKDRFFISTFIFLGMTPEEQAVLQELNLHNTLGTSAKLRGNCTERGSDNDRNTVNMCRSCQYDVKLPSE